MRKEILIAIIVGIGLGVAVAFGIWRANSALKTNLPELPALLQKTEPTTTPQELKLTISQPEQNDVITEDSVSVAGITKPGSWIVVSGETEDYVLQTEPSGSFSQEVELTSGVNQIIVAAIDENENKNEETLTVIYSGELAQATNEQASPTPNENSQNSDEIRENVQNKIEAAKQNPKAYLGTVTDKTQDSLQISNEDEEIQLVSVNSNVTFAKVNATSANISYDDIAIGDFVVAMGPGTGNGVLTAVRILVTDPVANPDRSIVYGTLQDIGKNKAVLLQNDQSEISLDFPRSWKGPDLDELEEGLRLIAVGELNGNTLDVKTIQVAGSQETSPSPVEN